MVGCLPDHVKEFEEIRFVFEMTKIYDSECREFLAERSDKPMKVRLGDGFRGSYGVWAEWRQRSCCSSVQAI